MTSCGMIVKPFIYFYFFSCQFVIFRVRYNLCLIGKFALFAEPWKSVTNKLCKPSKVHIHLTKVVSKQSSSLSCSRLLSVFCYCLAVGLCTCITSFLIIIKKVVSVGKTGWPYNYDSY